MKRLKPAAIALATGIVLAGASLAAAQDAAVTTTETTTTVETKPKDPFKPTIYFGPGFGYANQDVDDSEFGWSFQVLARPHENVGIQIEYLNLGSDPPPDTSGEQDGVYFGIMPVLPLGPVSLYGQVGAVIGDFGDDVAGGGGLMFNVPITFLNENNVELEMRADYKYLNVGEDEGMHLLVFGFMLGFHK